METNTWNQCDTETDGVRSALYLTVDVGASVQQHLDHGLVPAHAGVHERGHPLWEKQVEEQLQAGVSLFKGFETNLESAHETCKVKKETDGKLFSFEPEAFSPPCLLVTCMAPATQSDSSKSKSQKCTNIQNIPLFTPMIAKRGKKVQKTNFVIIKLN